MRMSKKKTKDTKIKKIVKLISDGKLDKALELADVNDVEDLFKIGTLFCQRGISNIAEKIFDRIIQLNPNYADAWYNKGVALGNLGKYDEEIKCYDEAIKINPHDDKAWCNKGVALGNLGKYDEALKCYDEAIKINPNYAEVWYNKGIALDNLGKYDEAIKCYDDAIKINPNLVDAWYNKGIALGNLGKYDEEIKCYDEAIKINPNYDKALINKGIALGNLGKYDEAIKCYEEAIKINPNDDKAWCNKGVALGNLGKYDEAIKCYDEVIKINPNVAEAYGNKGITLLNRHRYDEAEVELKIAKEIFSKRGMENDADKARRLEVLAKNALKLMSRLKPLDKKFESCCLRGKSLIELKNKSLEVSKGIKSVIEDFGKMDLPKDSIQLLKSKEICFTALSKSLNFEKVNLEILRETEQVFENWKLNTLATAVSFLSAFIRALERYNNLEKISQDAEEHLLQSLRTSYVLNGKLTEEIFKGEPYVTKPAGIEKEIEIKYVCIADIEKEWVRVCLAQLDFSLTNTFPYKLVEKEKVRQKIFEALEIAKNEKVNIICFPELSFVKEWIDAIKNNYKDMIIVCGSFYDEQNHNICKIIIDGKDYHYNKCHCSIMEEPNGEGLKKGDKLLILQTKYGIISVLTCIDFEYEYYHISNYIKQMNKQLNFLINPRYDIDREHRYQTKSNLEMELPDGSRAPTFILHINPKTTKYGETIGGGGTTIICNEHIYRIEKYKTDGLRPNDNIKYKIYQAKDEMLLIADLNIVPTTERRTKKCEWYSYDDRLWKKLNKSYWS